jgi:arabinan endo-1,5-alpha-L-arabinosidase
MFYHPVRGMGVIPGAEQVEAVGRRGIPLRRMCMKRLLFDAAGFPMLGALAFLTPRAGPVVRKRV